MFAILLASLCVMIASVVAVVFMWGTLRSFVERRLALLVSFSAGVFLVVVFTLGVEVFEHSNHFFSAVGWIIAGVVGLLLFFKFLPGFHHHHADDADHTHSRIDAHRIIVSDAIHNIGDGILLAASFAVSVPAGIAVALSIFVHEVVQEVSEFFVLVQAGYHPRKALIVNFIVSGTILIGSLGGYFLLDTFEALEVPVLAISAGAFLVVVLQDLIPESVRSSRLDHSYTKHIVAFLLGVLVMVGIGQIAMHGHEVDDHGSDDTHEPFEVDTH